MTNKNKYLMYILFFFVFCLPIELFAQKIPQWAIQPESLYDSEEYLFGVGEGATMEIAKNQAFVSLSSIFGATVK